MPFRGGRPRWCLSQPQLARRQVRDDNRFSGGSEVKNPPAMEKMWVCGFHPWERSPGEDPLTTHSNILAWEIPGTEEPGGLQSKGSQRVGHDLAPPPPPATPRSPPVDVYWDSHGRSHR